MEKSKPKLKNDNNNSNYYNNEPNTIHTNVQVITVVYFRVQTAFYLLLVRFWFDSRNYEMGSL
jgi:hypothetical protein